VLKEQAERLAEEQQQVADTLRALFDTLPAGVLVCDARGTYTMASRVAREMLGDRVATGNAYARPEGLELLLPVGAPFPIEDLPMHRALARGEVTRDVELRARRRDGPESVLLVSGSPIRDEEGAISGAVVAFLDITRRKQPRRSESGCWRTWMQLSRPYPMES